MKVNKIPQPEKVSVASACRTRAPDLEDPRVIEALDEYLAALEAGHRPNRQAFLARHTEVATALDECLEGMDILHGADSASSLPGAGAGLELSGQPGTPLGDFRILREIGRGGMGIVYEAEQLSLGRRIALKVLPFASTLDTRQLQRFKNEARAAAHLHHQHIVPVYNVGSERGVHFYAMQYIEGQSLAEVIKELRPRRGPGKAATPGATGSPQESAVSCLPRSAADTVADSVAALATAYSKNSAQFHRTVAGLGVQAAEALEHAHQYGVVHRDIKPANLLIDGQGQLWITDFGLARFPTDAVLTQTGDLVGTLRYMSPEQAAGQRLPLDHRTDVYSLGATLYELLTLQPPFDGADRQVLLQQILHDEPRPPRALDKAIPPELETIILKALAKAPHERYATAGELADDLSRFLENQPIRARRATWAQRARKWSRRHPSVVVATVLLCVLTAVGSWVSTGMIQAAYERERERARQAEERFLLAKESVDDMFNVCEEELAGQMHLDGLRRRLLEHALVYYQKLIEQRGDAPDEKGVLAANHARVQDILADLAVLHGDRLLSLLGEPAVLDDLGLAGERRQQITDLLRHRGKNWWALFRRRLPEEEKRRGFLTLARSNEAALEKILTRDQLARLRQIDLQKQGSRAFEDPTVTRALKLSAAQRERIHAIQAEAFFRGCCAPGSGKAPEKTSLSSVEKIVKTVLTADQARRWQELAGRTFKAGPRPRPGPWRSSPGDVRPRDKAPG
jgi:serine/threonine protein kinase